MAKKKILVVDDEKIMRDSIREALSVSGYDVICAEDGIAARDILNRQEFDIVLSDIKMPGMSGIELLKYVKQINPDTLVIIMTAFGTIESAIEAMREGAFDYLTKPFSVDQIEVVIDKAYSYIDIVRENKYLKKSIEDEFDSSHFIGQTEAMKSIFEIIRTVAPSKATVLVMGESGTGKELVARSLHFLSPRKNKPFIKLNCAALSSALLESELFGHEKGAFTGAYAKKIGRFEMADGGTLLLDEISEMDINLQSKLLRVLQEKEFERVGGVESIEVDVRIVATTNRDLEKAVREGRFREDLYYRLNVVPIKLPPLRERKEDIPYLIDYFLDKYNEENNKNIRGVEPEVYTKLKNYNWPGNVRELENAIERGVVLAKGEILLSEYFDMAVSSASVSSSGVNSFGNGLSFPEEIITIDELEKEYIYYTLDKVSWNKTKAAKLLGITVRTLRNKLDSYKILNGV